MPILNDPFLLKENDFAKQNIAPEEGISRSSFSEIINGR